jgi:Icc-related predicted phosphoesterase
VRWRRSRADGGAGSLRKILIVSDLHGSTQCLRKALVAAERYSAEAILIAGDLTGKFLVPFVRTNGGYTATHAGAETHVAADELDRYLLEAENGGMYGYVTTPDEVAELEARPEAVDAIFHRLVRERMQAWVELLEAALSRSGRTMLVIPGNDDFVDIDPVLEGGEHVRMADARIVSLFDEYEVLGLGLSNVTPWNAPRDVSEETLGERLGALAARLEAPERAIFLVHCPPRGTLIDLAPRIDASLRLSASGEMMHVGSTAVRAVIEEVQPLMGVHGHIHESPGTETLGRTAIFNPGSEYGQGILRGVYVALSGGRVSGHMFFSG